MSIRASVETVTPKKAREWLSKNIENRPLSDRHVLRLSEAMARGEWMVNIDNRASKGKLRGNAITALTIKAWNVSRNGDSIQSLGWRVDEDFPKVK